MRSIFAGLLFVLALYAFWFSWQWKVGTYYLRDVAMLVSFVYFLVAIALALSGLGVWCR